MQDTTEQPTAAEPYELTDREREILEFEQFWWKHPGAKDGAVRGRFDTSPTLYYAELNRLINQPAAMAYDPMLVKRLVRLRDARREQRSPRRAASS